VREFLQTLQDVITYGDDEQSGIAEVADGRKRMNIPYSDGSRSQNAQKREEGMQGAGEESYWKEEKEHHAQSKHVLKDKGRNVKTKFAKECAAVEVLPKILASCIVMPRVVEGMFQDFGRMEYGVVLKIVFQPKCRIKVSNIANESCFRVVCLQSAWDMKPSGKEEEKRSSCNGEEKAFSACEAWNEEEAEKHRANHQCRCGLSKQGYAENDAEQQPHSPRVRVPEAEEEEEGEGVEKERQRVVVDACREKYDPREGGTCGDKQSAGYVFSFCRKEKYPYSYKKAEGEDCQEKGECLLRMGVGEGEGKEFRQSLPEGTKCVVRGRLVEFPPVGRMGNTHFILYVIDVVNVAFRVMATNRVGRGRYVEHTQENSSNKENKDRNRDSRCCRNGA